MSGLKVGEAARLAGVVPQTLHYYERQGLLPEPPRTASNYRLYPEEVVSRVRFIKRAQELGFTLREIKELLSLRSGPSARCQDVRERARAKVRHIDAKLRGLRAMRAELTRMIDECAGEGPATECPILEALDSEEMED